MKTFTREQFENRVRAVDELTDLVRNDRLADFLEIQVEGIGGGESGESEEPSDQERAILVVSPKPEQWTNPEQQPQFYVGAGFLMADHDCLLALIGPDCLMRVPLGRSGDPEPIVGDPRADKLYAACGKAIRENFEQ